MRNLLLVALLLYNVVTREARSNNYDYDDLDGSKRHAILDDRRNWRKKGLLKATDDNKDWDRWMNRRHDSDQRYFDEQDAKRFSIVDRPRDRDVDMSVAYRSGNRHYDDNNIQQNLKSSERDVHSVPYMGDKELDKKILNCDRPHERFEACFAGCASVSCDNPRERLRPCYPFCEPGCICTHPYMRDDRTHKCVLPDECTKGLKGIPDLGDEI